MMSGDEVRYWLIELRKRHGWGSRVLGRTIGLRQVGQICPKSDGRAWLYLGEHVRAARQIERILAGELVCIPGKAGRKADGGYHLGRAVIAKDPKPLVGPMRFAYDLKSGRLGFIERDRPARLRVPTDGRPA